MALGVEATEASSKGDQARVFEIVNALADRRNRRLRDGGYGSVEDVVQEREAWKEHFEQVSKGRGSVNERVWENVTSNEVAHWLDVEPSIVEMEMALGQMKLRKAAGKDGVTVEVLKYGGEELKKRVFEVVQAMWRRAACAEEGHEAEDWPEEWKIGVTVPLWKKKGSRKDKNTWRGITLLSVGSKLLARVAARRAQQWSEGWLSEQQCGFRKGRGVDDCLTVSRRISEEVNRAVSSEWVAMSFFDIEKAYPRVCKDGLWKLLRRRGCPEGFLGVCRALHEHTKYVVKMYKGESSAFLPERGLREGCPTSPPLFNIYHDGVMEDFRPRRAAEARKRK